MGMTNSELPLRRTTIDHMKDDGTGVHTLSDIGPLRLGPLPDSITGESLYVEMWGPNEGRVVDRSYRPEREPTPNTMTSSAVESSLTTNGRLSTGDYVLGAIKRYADEGPILVAGGYRIQIPEVREGDLVLARVEEAQRQTYGANQARATRVDYPSLFQATIESGVGIRRLMADGTWREPVIGEVELRTLAAAVRRVNDGESTSILYPGFESDVSLRTGIELLYHAQPGTNVALLTSGSSVQWGQKGEIRDTYRGYGLSIEAAPSNTVVPLDQIFAHSYVFDGEMKTSSESLLDRSLVLTKKVDELSVIPDLAAIVVDYTSRKPNTDEETIERIREEFPDTPIVSIASIYTKNEGEGVPRYAPPTFLEDEETLPSLSDIKAVSSRYDSQVGRVTGGLRTTEYTTDLSGSPTSAITSDLLGLCRDPSTIVTAVESEGLSNWFEVAVDRSRELLDGGVDRAGHKIYSIEMFYERLPVPVDRYNQWIRDEWESGERYLPDTTDAVLDDLEEYGGKIDDLQAPAHIFAAHKALREIDEGLREENPLFERICEEISEAIEGEYRIGVFCPRKSWSHVLQEALVERGFSESVIGSIAVLLDPDSIRDAPPCHRLVFTGPQRPQYAGFYHHPRADETVVYTYGGRWDQTITKHARDYRQRLNTAISGSKAEPYPVPDIKDSMDDTDLNITELDVESTDSTSTESDSQRSEDGDSEDEIDIGDSELGEEDLQRLAQLVDLAPTKNAELAEKWGYDSGSEVYQYLSTHLQEYYERDENKLIIPTAEGERLVERCLGEA